MLKSTELSLCCAPMFFQHVYKISLELVLSLSSYMRQSRLRSCWIRCFCCSYAHCSYWPEMSCTTIFFGSIVLDLISINFFYLPLKIGIFRLLQLLTVRDVRENRGETEKMHQFRNLHVKILQFCFHDFFVRCTIFGVITSAIYCVRILLSRTAQ